MKLAFFTSLFVVAMTSVLADQVTYDPVYDNSDQSLDTVECSTGSNGLETKNFTTFGSLPTFPFIGGAQAVEGFNSASCGTCWQLSFNGTNITVTAIDTAGSGFNIAESAMNNLTNGEAVQLGVVQATATQLNASECGL